MFSTATPKKPSRPVPARESGVEVASVVAAASSGVAEAGAQEQRVVAEGEQQSVYARDGDDREQQSVHAQILQMLQQVRAEMAELRAEVQQVRTEVRAEMQQRMHTVEVNQAQLRAQIVGVEATLEQLAKDKESASAHVQQLKQEQGERIDAIEQQLLRRRDEEEKFRVNEIRVVRQEVQQVLEEHWRVNEQQFIDEIRVVRQEVQQVLEEHWRVNEQRLIEVEVHTAELESLLQALRDEQERLRDEQEKIKNNEKRVRARIEQFVRESAELVKKEAFDPLLARFE